MRREQKWKWVRSRADINRTHDAVHLYGGTRACAMAAISRVWTEQLRCRSVSFGERGARTRHLHVIYNEMRRHDLRCSANGHNEIKRKKKKSKNSAATSGTNKIKSLDGMRRAFLLFWCALMTTTTHSLKSEQMPAAAFYANYSKCKTPNHSEGNQLTFAGTAHKFISSLFRRARVTIYLDFTIPRNNRLSSAVVCFNCMPHQRHARRQMTE